MMEDIEELVRLHKLFDVVRDYVLSSGGDGDGWIGIIGDYKKVADLFEVYEKEASNNWFMTRYDTDDHVCFYHEQESIRIGGRAKHDGLVGDIFVRVYWNAGITNEMIQTIGTN